MIHAALRQMDQRLPGGDLGNGRAAAPASATISRCSIRSASARPDHQRLRPSRTCIRDIKRLSRLELVVPRERRRSAVRLSDRHAAAGQQLHRATTRCRTRRDPSDDQNTVMDNCYLIDFQRGYFFTNIDDDRAGPLSQRHDGCRATRSARDDNVIEMRWVLQREFASSVVFFHEVTIPPGTIEGTHQHIGTEELYCIVEGRGHRVHGRRRRSRERDHIRSSTREIYGLGVRHCRELPRPAGKRDLHQERRHPRDPQQQHDGPCGSSRSCTTPPNQGATTWKSSIATACFVSPPGTTPNYNKGSSLVTLMRLMEQTQLAADREWYLRDDLQYLFPFDYLELYGPSGGDADLLDPTRQDNKNDFQKQNVKRFAPRPPRSCAAGSPPATGRGRFCGCPTRRAPIPRSGKRRMARQGPRSSCG